MSHKRLMVMLAVSILAIMMVLPVGAVSFNQAPELDPLVEEGELPSVEERLPENPQEITPHDRIGDYGGTWRFFIDGTHATDYMMSFSHTGLLKWSKCQTEFKADLAEDWAVNEEGTEFTFHLREGLRWSDGEPFTTEDVEFWYEAILSNEEITAAPDPFYQSNGELMELEIIDDTSFTFVFEEPNGLFLNHVTTHNSYDFFAPKHYLKQFHIDYTDEGEVMVIADEEGYDEWYELFGSKNDTWTLHNPDRPYMHPWVPTTEPPSDRFTFVRNPYFYKVDTEGNQLPYLDEVVLDIREDEVIIMETVAGTPDFQPHEIIQFRELPMLMQNAESEGYEVLLWDHLTVTEPALHLNFNTEDEVLNDLFHTADFRKALSLGMNRERMSQMLYNGVAEPAQPSLSPVSRYYREEYLKAYTEYKPEEAKDMLLDIDILDFDDQGTLIGPDDEPISIEVMLPTGWPQMVDVLELVEEDWADLGIDLIINPVDPGLYWTNKPAGDYEIDAWPFAKSARDPNLLPNSVNSWAPDYARWYIAGREENDNAVEPPSEIKELFDIWDDIQATADQEEHDELYDTLLKRQAENLWIIGTIGLLPKVMPKGNHFHNVPEESTWSWHHGHYIGQNEVSQYFIEEDAQ